MQVTWLYPISIAPVTITLITVRTGTKSALNHLEIQVQTGES
jgi:hypothetical protein